MRESTQNVIRSFALSVLLIAGWTGQAGAGEDAPSRPAANTPGTTAAGNTFTIPAGWSLTARGNASILEAPEGNSWIALVDVEATQHDAAVAEAWAVYRPSAKWPLKGTASAPDENGWTDQRTYSYQTSPDEHRAVRAGAMRHGDRWMAWISDIDIAVAEKRLAEVALIFDSLLPRGYSPESFAGRRAATLDENSINELLGFIESAQKVLGVPGMSIGILQNGKKVFAGGVGVKELGRSEKPDADTLYLIASVTKPLTTLMLARLVDEKRLRWDAPVTGILPQFRLGNADTTRKVHVEHLVCACTGLPRQDLEWLMEFEDSTPASALAMLGSMQPTSGFGEIFQYSNLLAAAAGFVGGHVLFPDAELGQAYDKAMQRLVFDPLGMTSTTFDFREALDGNHASGHALDIHGKPTLANFDINYAVVPVRPAGGAWSSVNDLLKYVAMELANGKLPDGSRYIAADVLENRRTPRVPIGKDDEYAMGLIVSSRHGVRVVGHPGSMFGYRQAMLWLPDHDVGLVMLTNSDEGWSLTSAVERKLFELLFDGKPEADQMVEVAARATQERIAAERKLLAIPPDSEAAAQLADRYTNAALGDIAVIRGEGNSIIFDFGEWKSPVASRTNPDGSTSFVTITPSFTGKQFVMDNTNGHHALKLRDAQHEYVFNE